MNPWPPRPTSSILLVLFLSLTLSSLRPSSSSSDNGADYGPYLECSVPKLLSCGNFSINISYPFTSDGRPDYCGHPGYQLFCMGNAAMIDINNKQYKVKSIDYSDSTLTITDPSYSTNQFCPRPTTNTSLNASLFYFAKPDQEVVFFMDCNSNITSLGTIACLPGTYYSFQVTLPPEVSCGLTVLIGIEQTALTQMVFGNLSFGEALQEGFSVGWTAGAGRCSYCTTWGGVCGYDDQTSYGDTCYCPYGIATDACPPKGQKSNNGKKIAVGVGAGVVGIGLASFLLLFLYKSWKGKQPSSSIHLSLVSSPKSRYHEKRELAQVSIDRYRTHVFTYEELEEATNCFSASQEVGDGGFSAVYKGKLRDGRVVAVKRLYESHSTHAEHQFRNEVNILSGLRHQNLVTLYGSTTFHSRALLLVYEYVSNGTVSDHLCGSRTFLGWPIRMNIAIETADALSYLHAVEPQIIHRDVKTTNILVDDNFHVKVADFGLSRLFPLNVTHVSTAPMGTPGYVDPEYQRYFQVTDKSDVYSFGVVLAELISSKPAFDINRPREEVNLANCATKKIQNNELDQFVDPRLGYQSDIKIAKQINLVAELALRCLQAESVSRPSMKEVVEVLRRIEDESFDSERSSCQTFSGDYMLAGE